MKKLFEFGYTGDGFTDQQEEEFAEQQACERAVEGQIDAAIATADFLEINPESR